MDIDNTINKRILSGNFPEERLYPATIEKYEIDVLAEVESDLSPLKREPEGLSTIILILYSKLKEMEMLKHPPVNPYDFINCLINTRCAVENLRFDGAVQEAVSLNPVQQLLYLLQKD